MKRRITTTVVFSPHSLPLLLMTSAMITIAAGIEEEQQSCSCSQQQLPPPPLKFRSQNYQQQLLLNHDLNPPLGNPNSSNNMSYRNLLSLPPSFAVPQSAAAVPPSLLMQMEPVPVPQPVPAPSPPAPPPPLPSSGHTLSAPSPAPPPPPTLIPMERQEQQQHESFNLKDPRLRQQKRPPTRDPRTVRMKGKGEENASQDGVLEVLDLPVPRWKVVQKPEDHLMIKSLKAEMKMQSDKHETLVNEMRTLNTELEKKAREAANQISIEVASKAKCVADFERALKEKNTEIAEINARNAEILRSHSEQLQRVSDEHRQEFATELKKRLQRLKEEHEMDLAAERNEKMKLQTENEKLQSEIESLLKTNDNLREENTALRDSQKHMEKLRDKLKRCREAKTAVEADRYAERKLREDAEQCKQKLLEESNALKTLIDELRRRNETENSEHKRELTEVRQSFQAQISQKEQDANKHTEKLSAKLERKRKRIEDFKSQLETERFEHEKLDEELRVAKSELQKLQNTMKDTEERNQIEREDANRAQADLSAELAETVRLLGEERERSTHLEMLVRRLLNDIPSGSLFGGSGGGAPSISGSSSSSGLPSSITSSVHSSDLRTTSLPSHLESNTTVRIKEELQEQECSESGQMIPEQNQNKRKLDGVSSLPPTMSQPKRPKLTTLFPSSSS